MIKGNGARCHNAVRGRTDGLPNRFIGSNGE